MLDLRLIRRDPDAVRAALARRGESDVGRLDRVIELDARRREILPRLEGLRAEQNAANQAIAAAKKAGEGADEAIAKMRAVASEAKGLNDELATVDADLTPALAQLPNLPDETAAPQDTVLREVGEPWVPEWPVRDHLELAGPDRIDTERGARLSGSRFAYLRGDVARLELSLVSWVLDLLSEQGFEPVIPPVLVREEALYGTGFLPDTEQQIYHLPADDLYLVGTSEVALASLHAGEILEALPMRYAGFSPCFRREAGAAGKDTRGIFRVHQFDKVEMFSFVEPSAARDEHERLLAIEESIMQALNLPYRVVNIAVDDLGASAAKKYDIEAWLPSQKRYRELTSTSNTTDYQARRLEIRYRPDGAGGKAKPEVVHTLNGTAVAVGRTLIAVLENGQQEDGSVALPEALRAYGAPASLPPAG
ncbi:Serine--tRNA ligase [Baekduia alba]|uniref:serine--tRNA ligase n=1 Tax=Baekduia alba TaxID=2997333 RepID=UPI002340F8AB|nr:serine--tRNA ligase [Baekduia alba]WCB92086.1 Serine--tRNA ligase [Baekduia alba]